jgi:hypothetical protein
VKNPKQLGLHNGFQMAQRLEEVEHLREEETEKEPQAKAPSMLKLNSHASP